MHKNKTAAGLRSREVVSVSGEGESMCAKRRTQQRQRTRRKTEEYKRMIGKCQSRLMPTSVQNISGGYQLLNRKVYLHPMSAISSYALLEPPSVITLYLPTLDTLSINTTWWPSRQERNETATRFERLQIGKDLPQAVLIWSFPRPHVFQRARSMT